MVGVVGASKACRLINGGTTINWLYLGSCLVRSVFYRVSDFLEPRHVFMPIHRQFFEGVSSLVCANKVATPVTLKTFFPADADIAGLPLHQYLARLAAEAPPEFNRDFMDTQRSEYPTLCCAASPT
jgi:DnaB-like helicase N terminal domain